MPHIESNLIVSLVIAIFASTGFWAFLTNIINNKSEKKSAQGEMLRGIAHDKLYDKCNKSLKNGEITPSEYDNLLNLYRPYTRLGGNGTIKKLMKEVDELPIVYEGDVHDNHK